MTQYEIELLPSNAAGAKTVFYRAGRRFETKAPQVLDLTDEEFEVFKNDSRFKISGASNSSKKKSAGTADPGETKSSSAAGKTKKDDASEVEAVQDTNVAQEKKVSDEATKATGVDELKKKYSRDELDQIAAGLQIAAPQSFDSKTEVAQAIVEAQTNG